MSERLLGKCVECGDPIEKVDATGWWHVDMEKERAKKHFAFPAADQKSATVTVSRADLIEVREALGEVVEYFAHEMQGSAVLDHAREALDLLERTVKP